MAQTRAATELTAAAVSGPSEAGGSRRRWWVRRRTRSSVDAETQHGSESTIGKKDCHCCCSTGRSAHMATSANGRSTWSTMACEGLEHAM